MAGKGKKGAKNEKPIVVETNIVKKNDNKEEEMNRIMAGINNMDLDDENFIDTASFDQSRAILDNAMEELTHYLKIFNKGDFRAFPRVKVD
jgi:hypothetical protein